MIEPPDSLNGAVRNESDSHLRASMRRQFPLTSLLDAAAAARCLRICKPRRPSAWWFRLRSRSLPASRGSCWLEGLWLGVITLSEEVLKKSSELYQVNKNRSDICKDKRSETEAKKTRLGWTGCQQAYKEGGLQVVSLYFDSWSSIALPRNFRS